MMQRGLPHRHFPVLFLLTLAMAAPCCGAPASAAEPPSARPLTGKKWIDMDYGPFMTHSFQAERPDANIAYKGIKIRLGNEGQAVLFDTDLLRYAAGWLDCDLDWRNVIYDGSHNAHPHVLGDPVFANPNMPGWARDGSFGDPRPLPYGPLPRDWAHYNGLYLHGNNVILSYTVGDAGVLEMPSLERSGPTTALARNLEIGKSSRDLLLQICADEKETASLVSAETLEAVAGDGQAGGRLVLFGRLATEKKKPPRPVAVSDEGLVGRWKFDEPNGTTAANALGDRYTGKLVHARRVPGVEGGALSLNGRSRVTLSDGDKIDFGSSDFTITAWIKTAGGGTIVAKNQPAGAWTPNGKSFFVRDGRLGFDIGWVGVVTSSRRVADGRWHHVAVVGTRADGMKRLYVDGAVDGQRQLAAPDAAGHVVAIGYTATNFVAPFRGAIDDVRIYARALSPAEIAAMAGTHVDTRPSVTVVACAGAPNGVCFDLSEPHHVRLHIPASATPARLKILIGRVSTGQGLAGFAAMARSGGPPVSLESLTKGGPPRWPEKLVTEGKIGEGDGPWVIDTLPPPYKNPWHSWMRLTGVDFFADGRRAAVCTWSGDVWIVSGIDQKLEKLTWQRIATGMFQPLGLKIVDETIYVTCRDQINRLHDLNGDGEIDFYENFNNDHQVTEHFHEFAMDLDTDKAGNFYYAKGGRHAKTAVVPQHGTIIKVSKDGRTSEILCNGLRAPNGLAIGPNGEIATSDQEGHWKPANPIILCKKGGFYGYMWSYIVGDPPTTFDPPVVWLPKNVDRSPAEPIWVGSDNWGLARGKMIESSYGMGQIFHIMYEQVDGVYQGGAVRLPLQFPTGIMRGRFHTGDGQFYVCGMVGWSSNCALEGGFYRVRYTGKPLYLPTALKITDKGVALTFTDPLDKASAEDVDNYNVEQWTYLWHATYGSPELKVSNPKKRGHDEMEVWEATLSKDGKTVFLEIEDIQPVMQMQISFTLKAADGAPVKNSVWLTINKLGKSR